MATAQLYEVELPDGRILEVEGDRAPTRAELARYLTPEQAKPPGMLERFDRFMRTPVERANEFSAANPAPSMSEDTMAPSESRGTTAADVAKFKEIANTPLLNLTRMTAADVARLGNLDTPDLTTGDLGRERRIPADVAGGLYNAAAPLVEGLSSPTSLAITGAFGGAGKLVQMGVKGARSALGAASVGFGALTAKETIRLAEHAGEVLADPMSTTLQRTEAAAAPVLTGLLSASMLAGGARIGATEAVPALAKAYPAAFWKQSGLTPEEFAQVYPPTVRRVAANQGSASDIALVQRINEAAGEAGVAVGDLARGRATAELIDWQPRATTKLVPPDLLPAAPGAEVRFSRPPAGSAQPTAPAAPMPPAAPVDASAPLAIGQPAALAVPAPRPAPAAPVPIPPAAIDPVQPPPASDILPAEIPAPIAAAPLPPTVPAATVLAHGDPVKVPRAEIAQRPDLMQFKRVDEGASGINAEDKLTGTWDPLKGGLLLLWEPANGAAHGLTGAQRYIVANGHHRVEFGDRVDNQNYNAQVIREADGFSASDARRLGAEINIADGKGNIYDQAKFIRNIAAAHGPDEALAAGRRVGARGRKAANIGLAAGPDAFDAFINERIGADHAEQIALAAPGQDGLQRVGVGAAIRGANPQEAANLVRAAASMQAGPQGAQGDLFGADESALLAMEAQAKRATAIQNQLTEDIRAVQGAAKNPAAAKKYGVNVKDQAGLEAKLEDLKKLRARWDNWHLEPDLVAQVRPAPVEPPAEVAPAPPPDDANQIDMFGGEPPAAPPTGLDQFNGSALLPAPEKLDMPVQPEAVPSPPPPPPRRGSSGVGDPGPLEPGMPPIPPGIPAGNLNHGRMPVAMERMAPGTVDVPAVLDALRGVARAAGSMTDIREGRFYNNALGIAKSWEEVIRVRQLNNLPTAAHEVGHIVSKAIFGSMKSKPMMRQAFPAPVVRELQAMGKALYGATKPVAGYTAEGFAELVRLWLSTEDAARRAPAATKWLEETLFPMQSAKGPTPSLGQAMRHARDQFDLWRAQGAEGRIGAQTKDEPGRWQRVKTWAKENLSGRAVGEEFAPLEELAKAYTATTGNRLAPGENPYMIATALRSTAGAKLETWVEHAMTDINGTVKGPSLREAVAPVRAADAEKFQIYLTVRQAIERLKQGKNPGIEQEDAVYVRDKYEKAHPEFIAAAEGMADWWSGVLNYVEQAWPAKNSQVIAAVRKSNPRYFGPLARVLDSDRVRPGKAEGTGGGIHRFKGSGLPIKKLLLQSLYVAEGMIAQAHRDMIAQSVFRLVDVEGMGWIVEEVPITKAMEQVNIEKLRAQLEAMGVDTSAIAPDEMLSYATTRDTPTGIDPIIALDTANGKRWFQVPAMVFEILEGVQEPARLGAVFELFAGMPARAFKLGTTGVRASFALVTNPARDLPTFMLQSIAGNPASRVAAYFGSLGAIVKAGLGGNQSPAYELVRALGLQSSTFLGGDIAQARREARGLFHGKFFRRITSPVETLREILSFTESAPRMAELELIGRELGWKPGQPLTRDQAVAMMVAFKRVTTDFSARGSKWRAYYRSVPFSNAAVQGARAMGRAFSRDQGTKEKHYAPLRAVLNSLTLLTLPALWNYWANKDEEWFKMLPWRERYLYLNVSQGRNVYQIPLPPEWGAAFAVLPVAALDSWYHDDRRALTAALHHVFDIVNPLDYPVLAKAAKEQWTNKIEFFNRPMVPRGEVDLLAGMQRGPYTSEIGAELGDIFPNQVSPRRFDAAVRAVFGGVGGDVIDTPGALMRALGLKTQIANRELEPSDFPVLGRLARRGGQFSAATQPITEFWDDYNRYSAWKASNHKALMDRTPMLQPMSFQEQAYAARLGALEPFIKFRLEIAARTPELDKRQAIYKATSERAKRVLETRPRSAQVPPK